MNKYLSMSLRLLLSLSIGKQHLEAAPFDITCLKIQKSVLFAYKDLSTRLSSKIGIHPAQKQFLSLDQEKCRADKSEQTIQFMNQVLSQHGKKLGLLLPQKGPYLAEAEAVHAVLNGLYKDMPDSLKVTPYNGEVDGLLKALADLTFKEDISIIMGGFGIEEGELLSLWAEKLLLPMLILAPPKKTKTDLAQSLYLAPPLEDLLEALFLQAKIEKKEHILVLAPQSPSNTYKAQLINALLKKAGLKLSGFETYNTQDFPALEAKLKTLFKIDSPDRSEEKEALYEELKAKGLSESVALKNLELPPIVNFDSLLILDDFRNVQHLVKTLKYLGLSNLNLMGLANWRAQTLVKSGERLLEGATIVDIISRLDPFQAELALDGLDPEGAFADPKGMQTLDYRLMAYRGGLMAYNLLQHTAERRRKLSHALLGQFNAHRQLKWVPQLMKISNAKLSFKL